MSGVPTLTPLWGCSLSAPPDVSTLNHQLVLQKQKLRLICKRRCEQGQCLGGEMLRRCRGATAALTENKLVQPELGELSSDQLCPGSCWAGSPLFQLLPTLGNWAGRLLELSCSTNRRLSKRKGKIRLLLLASGKCHGCSRRVRACQPLAASSCHGTSLGMFWS